MHVGWRTHVVDEREPKLREVPGTAVARVIAGIESASLVGRQALCTHTIGRNVHRGSANVGSNACGGSIRWPKAWLNAEPTCERTCGASRRWPKNGCCNHGAGIPCAARQALPMAPAIVEKTAACTWAGPTYFDLLK